MSFKKDFFKPKNYLKLFYKPGKIFTAIRMYYHAYYNARTDIKYRELTDKQIISLYKNSLKALGRLASRSKKTLQIQTIEEVFGTGLEKNIECIQLGELFKTYGSDKSDHYNPLLQDQHNYYLIYFALLQHKRAEALKVLEIGLGTNNLDVLSNMGKTGRPGASLRAFKDFLPNAYIYGADIDQRILFKEERIETFFIDQTNLQILYRFKQNLGNTKFDLIIDDGLHNSEANLNTIDFALDLLSENGILMIEDIKEEDVIYYRLLYKLLEERYSMQFIKTKLACVCLIKALSH